ncbi:MAG: efflux RND transporter periplasmic adaptor subunit [Pseudomonadota bacterium]
MESVSKLVLFLFVVFSLSLPACSGDKGAKGGGGKKGPVAITAAAAVKKTIPVQIQAIGNVQAYSTVTVKAQIAGELMAVHFKEGRKVNRGDLLFTIDRRPFETRLKQLEADLARDKARLDNARKQVERYNSVVGKGFVSEESCDKVRTEASTLEATVKADEAAIETAKLEIQYCTIKSPIAGYTGEVKVDQGNVIKPNDNDRPLVTIRQTSPIYVVFSAPEKDLAEIRRHMAGRRLEVLATLQGTESRTVRGELSSVDNSVDPSTGTIQIKAIYPNDDNFLWPGQFVNVILTLANRTDAIVVPSHAVQTGQQGTYVFVVKPDSTVETRPVTVDGITLHGESIINKGVLPGDRVVTDGHLRLFPGAKVKVVKD